MNVLLRLYSIVSIFWLLISLWSVYDVDGSYWMENKWKMMKEMYDKGKEMYEEKEKKYEVKVIPIPIPVYTKEHPVPVPVPVYKPPPMKAVKAKPCKGKSKDWLWKLMMLKAVKGDKGKPCCPKTVMVPIKGCKEDKGCKGCKGRRKRAAKGCSMEAWPMMMEPEPCTPCQPMMAMKGCAMKAGWPPMMSGGWAPAMSAGWAPMMPAAPMCCPSSKGWPEEEEEEEEEPDYYEEEQMSGWDTNDFPVYLHPDDDLTSSLKRPLVKLHRRKGEDSDEIFQDIKRRFLQNKNKNFRTSNEHHFH